MNTMAALAEAMGGDELLKEFDRTFASPGELAATIEGMLPQLLGVSNDYISSAPVVIDDKKRAKRSNTKYGMIDTLPNPRAIAPRLPGAEVEINTVEAKIVSKATKQGGGSVRGLSWQSLADMGETKLLHQALNNQKAVVNIRTIECLSTLLKLWNKEVALTVTTLGGWHTLQRMLRHMVLRPDQFSGLLRVLRQAPLPAHSPPPRI